MTEVANAGLAPKLVVVAVGGGGLRCGVLQGMRMVGVDDTFYDMDVHPSGKAILRTSEFGTIYPTNALAAQAMFPPTSPAEMAGQQGENEVADAKAHNNVAGAGGVWDHPDGPAAALQAVAIELAAAFE